MNIDSRWGRDPLSKFYGFPVTRDEQAALHTWMEKHESQLPSMRDGEDRYICRYKFLPNQDARLDMGDDIDDRDGAEFAQESFREAGETELDTEKAEAYEGTVSSLDTAADKAIAYPSLESSGDLASSWSRIEKMLGSFWESKKISPSQFLRLEQSRFEPKRKQYRNGRAKNSNWSVMQRVWNDESQTLKEQHVEKFFTQRCESFMILDPVTKEYRELPRYTFTDDVALDAERRRVERGSKRPPGIVVNDAEVKPYVIGVHGPAPQKPRDVRSWSGDVSDLAYREWAQQGPTYRVPSTYEGFEGLQRFKLAMGGDAAAKAA